MNLLGAVDERRDALMRAALQPPGLAREAWRRWAAEDVDPWSDPVALRWLPLIGWNLRAVPIDDRSRTLFRQVQHSMWAANIRVLNAATPALGALAAAGIRVIALKGAPLALSVYETSGLRPIGDVDVLVEPAHASAALDVLARAGWQSLRRIDSRDLLLCHGVNLQQAPHGALDLHWYLLAECCWPGVDAGQWQRARPFAPDRLPALILSPADQLLHICLHGLRWSPVPTGHWVADAARVIAHAGSDLDWDVLVDEACRRRLALQMAGALRVLERAADVPVPGAVVRRLDAQPATWRDRLECRVKVRPVASPGGLFLLWCSRARLARAVGGRAPGRLRYLAASVGVESRWRLLPWAVRHARSWISTAARRLFKPPRLQASKHSSLEASEPQC